MEVYEYPVLLKDYSRGASLLSYFNIKIKVLQASRNMAIMQTSCMAVFDLLKHTK